MIFLYSLLAFCLCVVKPSAYTFGRFNVYEGILVHLWQNLPLPIYGFKLNVDLVLCTNAKQKKMAAKTAIFFCFICPFCSEDCYAGIHL